MYFSPKSHFSQRLDLIMAHIPRYAFDGPMRLSKDTGLGSSTIYQLLKCERTPTYRTAILVADALSQHLGREIHPAEIFSFSGTFRTASICDVCACSGCLPESAFNEDGSRKEEFKALKGGDWHQRPGIRNEQEAHD